MIPRQALKPNNRSLGKLNQEMKISTAIHTKYPKNGERQSIFGHARTGRQNSEGFGGGNRVF